MSNQRAEPTQRCDSVLTATPLSVTAATEFAAMFKAIADPVRLRLLSLIAAHRDGQACVCDLSGAFELSGPTISHHLKVLRESGIITGERHGTWIYYRVLPAAIRQLAGVLTPAATDTYPDTPAEPGERDAAAVAR